MKKTYSLLLLSFAFIFSCSNSADSGVDNSDQEEFLIENATRDDVSVTDSGLQFRIIEEGDGRRPQPTSTVTVDFEGRLINGNVFDTTLNGEPITFSLSNVIPGFREGVLLMREGDMYEFFLPTNLGYGNSPPAGSSIPRGAVLIFQIELINVDTEAVDESS